MKPGSLRKNKGFTLIELMIVIAIIGILAAIAIPNFISYRQRSYDSTAMTDIGNAYLMSQAYYVDYPNATLDISSLRTYGFKQSTGVSITINNGLQTALAMTAKHADGVNVYSVDSAGTITF